MQEHLVIADGFAQIVKDCREAKVNGPDAKPIKEAFNWIADRIEAALASHDQKVRADTLPAKLIQDSTWRDGWRWTCKHGNESSIAHTEILGCGCQLVIVAAPAASKPEAGSKGET